MDEPKTKGRGASWDGKATKVPFTFRKAFPYIVLALLIGAVAWAVSLSPLPPADFTFDNGTECQTLDPAKATGNPRQIDAKTPRRRQKRAEFALEPVTGVTPPASGRGTVSTGSGRP